MPWLALLALAVLTYSVGLDGLYIPSNGDEMVYAHIARLTAQSGHWLPLQSELEAMRNTKPPLLFWQAMVAGDWGGRWHLWALRLPSLVYTLAVTTGLVLCTRRITGSLASGLLTACIYLSFFCTYRYGRPYLTSAAESFWFGMPMLALLWIRSAQSPTQHGPCASASHRWVGARLTWVARVGLHLTLGLAWGLGLAFKSFALIAPVATAFWLAWVLSAQPWPSHSARQSARKYALGSAAWTAFSAAIALAIFSLWFVLDPDPQAVWQEFVVGENAGKLADAQGYWYGALHGGSSMWAQALAYLQNAGLMAFVALGLMSLGVQHMATVWRDRRLGKSVGSKGSARLANAAPAAQPEPAIPAVETLLAGPPAYAAKLPPAPRFPAESARLSPVVWVLLAWLAVWLLVFMVPSQRSARYVIPAMPALAILIALYWHKIGRVWFALSLILAAIVLAFLGRIAAVAHDLPAPNAPILGASHTVNQLPTGTGSASLVPQALSQSSAAQAAAMLPTAMPFEPLADDGWALNFALAGVLALGGCAVLAAIVRPRWLRASTLVCCLLVFTCFDLAIAPLNGPLGRFDAASVNAWQRARIAAQAPGGARIAAPNGFNGQFERFEFLLPGHRFVPYDVQERAASRASSATAAPAQQQLQQLLQTHDAVLWQQDGVEQLQPPCLPDCAVVAARWDVKGRHKAGEIHWGNLWQPEQWLFRREWLVLPKP